MSSSAHYIVVMLEIPWRHLPQTPIRVAIATILMLLLCDALKEATKGSPGPVEEFNGISELAFNQAGNYADTHKANCNHCCQWNTQTYY